VRVRGLKPGIAKALAIQYGVAPRAGAWIETGQKSSRVQSCVVAPRAGAWIETGHPFEQEKGYTASHPVRVRGLKHHISYRHWQNEPVAPRAGAWIETHYAHASPYDMKSHPVRVRGLKQQYQDCRY